LGNHLFSDTGTGYNPMDTGINLPPINVAALLRTYHLNPKKGLGQNFLIDQTALQRVVDAAEIEENAVVLEVGPGLGSLTRILAARSQKVIAVELDQKIIPILEQVVAQFPNVVIIHEDILNLDLASTGIEDGYLVVANIPYYITSALIRHLLEGSKIPSRLVLTVQKEVALRLCAVPNEMNLLALSVQVYGSPKVVGQIPAGCFYPVPEVDSSILRVDLYPEPVIPADRLPLFFRLAKAAFSQKRKMIRNSISSSMHWPVDETGEFLQEAEIDSQRRAETLSLQEWGILVNVVERYHH
jgi:16S rRNA (adenine1518-N6/adenine1519-N6)-dimethyltransferase